MKYKLEDLQAIYAEQNEITMDEAFKSTTTEPSKRCLTMLDKKLLDLTITRIETMIDSYTRIAEKASRQAFLDCECGNHESSRFNKGQQFALQYVIEDLQIILQGLKDVEVPDHG